MGKFESYPEANALGDNDITLYNKNTVTHKITFSRLVSLIKNKIAQTGLVTSISTGAGLVGGTITSSGTIKCKLKSETVSSLSSANPTITANRQYAVGLDREGYLSVNVPWTENSTYSSGTAIDITNGTINVILDNTYSSSSTAKAASAKAVKDAYDNSMRKDGGNADTHVHFSNALTVGATRKLNSTIGSSSVCFGYGNIASASNSFASGAYTEASEFASHSEGYGTDQSNYTNGQYNEYDDNATANISATAYGSHAEGYTTYDDQSGITGIIQANGMGSHAEGYAEARQGDGVIIAYGKGSHAEGYADSAKIGADCCTIAKGDGSHAEGIGTHAEGDGSHAEGRNSVSSGRYSHAEGDSTTASGDDAHAEGANTEATGEGSHAEGLNTKATQDFSHAEGQSTEASGNYSHAEGNGTKALYAGCHTEGYQTKTENPYAHAEGYQTTAKGAMAHSEGQESIARGHVSHAEGQFTESSGSFSHAEGSCGIASGVGSHVEGGVLKGSPKNLVLYQSQNNNTELVKTTDTSFISGKTYYLKPYTITPAVNANPKQNHWLELQSANVYIYSQDLTVDSSKTYYDCDVVFGDANQPSASGYFAHSEGNYTVASGHYSHAEGQGTTASGNRSHAEGQNTIASGNNSHSEGVNTTASGNYSHAEGKYTQATYQGAHVGGARVISTQEYQFLQGGNDYKFGAETYGRGIFGVSPNAVSYTSSDIEQGETSITLDGTNSVSASVENSVSVLINLSNYAMYMLYWTTYSGTDDATMSSGMQLISTSAATNNPYIQNILSNTIIDSVSANSITLVSSNKYMFHLIRII